VWWNWLPWRFVVSRLARAHGFVDPLGLLSRLHRFAQPSEVAVPIELLRAGVVFHARGLINSRAIQHNLDWVWPFWIERQFDPRDAAFVPRAFSITHVNLTHRNWTAVGLPDVDAYPLVDPRGLVTPLHDGWSLDAWVLPEHGAALLPSRADDEDVAQEYPTDAGLAVETRVRDETSRLRSRVDVVDDGDEPACRVRLEARSGESGWLAVSLRPANPEGVSLVHVIESVSGTAFAVNDEDRLEVRPEPSRFVLSDYHAGDVALDLVAGARGRSRPEVRCDVGLATAAALYRLEPDRPEQVEVRVPLRDDQGHAITLDGETGGAARWENALDGACQLRLPDERIQSLFETASRVLVLLSPGTAYPGPYTYRRFWFRDAALMLEGLLELGLGGRVREAVRRFPEFQTVAGYFRSQEGEWDSNGAAMWILDRLRRLSGQPLDDDLVESMARGARWIARKRLDDDLDEPHAGLLPAGFSAEHLGPNDYYYWDDFWSAAGLQAAGATLESAGRPAAATEARREADRLLEAVDRSLRKTSERRRHLGIPAAPYRRMDAGAVGSLAASYPLQLWKPRDPRLLATARWLRGNCIVEGGFFQDMIHSGVNPYLTLHLAQVLLRAGDPGHRELVEAVAGMASPTGQWPEAIHPHTGGGCMGDGQHGWAAAEWVLMLRRLFVREEEGELILGSGLAPDWLQPGEEPFLGPTPTPHGTIGLGVRAERERIEVAWEADWRDEPPALQLRLPGVESRTIPAGSAAEAGRVVLDRLDEPGTAGAADSTVSSVTGGTTPPS